MVYQLGADVRYRGRLARVVSRCCVNGSWVYGLRLQSGTIVDYVPARMLSV